MTFEGLKLKGILLTPFGNHPNVFVCFAIPFEISAIWTSQAIIGTSSNILLEFVNPKIKWLTKVFKRI